MKIAIAAEGPDLEADVGERIGRCRYILIVDTVTSSVEATPNPGASDSGSGGAGIQAVVLAICVMHRSRTGTRPRNHLKAEDFT